MKPTNFTPYEMVTQVLEYDPNIGGSCLRWKRSRNGRASAGKMAGSRAQNGYWRVQIFGVRTLAHRIVWLLVHKTWPAEYLDHVDRDKGNNKVTNLREATAAENGQNRKINTNSTSGYTGVHWSAAKRKWRAMIQINKKKVSLGSFVTPEEAHAAYLAAKAHYHVFNPFL